MDQFFPISDIPQGSLAPSSRRIVEALGLGKTLLLEPFLRREMADAAGDLARPRPYGIIDRLKTGYGGPLTWSTKVEAPDIYVLELDDAIVTGERTFVTGTPGRVITDSDSVEHDVRVLMRADRRQFERNALQFDGRVFSFDRPDVASEAVPLPDSAIFLSSMEENNYGAFLLRVVPKLIQMQDLGCHDRPVVVTSNSDWKRRILGYMGVAPQRLIHHAAEQAYRGRNLLVPSLRLPTFFLDDRSVATFQSLADRLSAGAALPADVSDHVYVSRIAASRANPGYRAMQNEPELVEVMRDQGYFIFEPQLHPFEVQVQVFAQAKVVVGAGGAGMFNTIFCRPGTTVLSMEPQPDWLVGHSNIFASMGHRYILAVGGSDPTDHSVQKRWSADIAGVVAMLAHIGEAHAKIRTGATDFDHIGRSALTAAELLAHVEVLRREWRLIEADAWLAQYVARFPDNEALQAEFAKNARLRNDNQAARSRWRDFVAQFPDNPGGFCNLADLLIHVLKEFDEAEDILAAARDRFPGDLNVAIYFATVARCRGRDVEALERWRKAHDMDEAHPFSKIQIAELEETLRGEAG